MYLIRVTKGLTCELDVGDKLSKGYKFLGYIIGKKMFEKAESVFLFCFVQIGFIWVQDWGLINFYYKHDNLNWTTFKKTNLGCYLINESEYQKRYYGKKYQLESYENKSDI